MPPRRCTPPPPTHSSTPPPHLPPPQSRGQKFSHPAPKAAKIFLHLFSAVRGLGKFFDKFSRNRKFFKNGPNLLIFFRSSFFRGTYACKKGVKNTLSQFLDFRGLFWGLFRNFENRPGPPPPFGGGAGPPPNGGGGPPPIFSEGVKL